MPFAKPTVDEIRDRALRDYTLLIPDAEVGQDSDYWVTASLLANVASPMYANGEFLAKESDPKTATEDVGLPILGARWGVPKLGEAFADGTATVSASFGTSIPDGAIVKNLTKGTRYRTIGVTAVNPAATPQGTCALVALASGPTSDEVAGTILTFESPPPGVNPVLTVVSIDGGDNAWDTPRWRREIAKRMRSTPSAGNPAHIVALGNSVPGVEQTFVYGGLRGSGTMDVIITTSASTGGRVAGTSLLNRVGAALLYGARPAGGQFLSGIPHDVLENTQISAGVAQPLDVQVAFKASLANPFAAWPPAGTGYVVPGAETSWYKVFSSTSTLAFVVHAPATGTSVAPTVGKTIGAFFPSKGFCKASIASVATSGGGTIWTITVGNWKASDGTAPTEAVIAALTVLSPWSDALTKIAAAPKAGSLALTGCVPAFFASLGPGEMTPLTADDVSKRRRWPGVSDTNPIDGTIEYPTDVTSRLGSAVDAGTDCVSSVTTIRLGGSSTPTIPSPSFIGAPPSILTLGTIAVIPTP